MAVVVYGVPLNPTSMRFMISPLFHSSVSHPIIARFSRCVTREQVRMGGTAPPAPSGRKQNYEPIRNTRFTIIKIGIRMGMLYLIMYPKNEGMSTPPCSAIALTMKFGPLPM